MESQGTKSIKIIQTKTQWARLTKDETQNYDKLVQLRDYLTIGYILLLIIIFNWRAMVLLSFYFIFFFFQTTLLKFQNVGLCLDRKFIINNLNNFFSLLQITRKKKKKKITDITEQMTFHKTHSAKRVVRKKKK